MSAIQPTGRVVRDKAGLELIVQRRIRLSATELWEWLTTPEKLTLWIGQADAVPALGETVPFTITGDGAPVTEPLTVLSCDAPARFTCTLGQPGIEWHLRVSLAEADGVTMLFLSQRISTAAEAGTVGPGWEYYLDRLVSAVVGAAMPDFAGYFPSQRPYFERLAMATENRSSHSLDA